MSERTKDILVRAGKTFVQSAVAAVVTAVVAWLNGGGELDYKALATAALAAGISAVWNFALTTKKGDGDGNN